MLDFKFRRLDKLRGNFCLESVFFLFFAFCTIVLATSFCSFSFALGITSEDNAQPVKIIIRKSSFVNTRKIFLGDIAVIRAPDFLKQSFNKITLGFAPRPGHFRILDGKYLRAKIKSYKPDFPAMSVSVPDEVYIKRKSQEISRKDLKKIFTNYISHNIRHKEFEIRNFAIRGIGVYPNGNLSLSVCNSNNNNEDIKGRISLYVRVSVNHRNFGRISLSGWVDVFATVICVSKDLGRGTILTLNDLKRGKLNISKFFGNYFTDFSDVQGKALKTYLARGRCITSDMVEAPALVHRGDFVKMVAASGSLKIVTSGIAKTDGRLNEQIRVKNISSGKVVYVVVKGKARVEALN